MTKVSTLFYKTTPMKRVLNHLFVEVDKAYREGTNILILSDRGVDENHVAIPSLLAVAAVHKHLVETRKCTAMSLIVESGEPREVHHFATLLGYGASAVNPYLAHATIRQLVEDELLAAHLLDTEVSSVCHVYDVGYDIRLIELQIVTEQIKRRVLVTKLCVYETEQNHGILRYHGFTSKISFMRERQRQR